MQSVLHAVVGPAAPPTTDLTSRVALITGGAEGIGEEIAIAMAKQGCKVILVNRKEEQGNEAIERVKKETGGKGEVEWVGCDLGELAMVKEVFKGLAGKLERLDYLILSSGINSNQFGLDNDKIDRHFGVNALGHYYVINLLYPLLRKTASSTSLPNKPPHTTRIVFESSEMHRFAPGSQDSPSRGRGLHFGSEEEITEGGKELGPVELYGRTKLAMILYTKSLKDKVIEKNGDDIYVLAVHPGAVNTKMQDQWEAAYPGVKGTIAKYVTLATGRSPEQGSYSALYAALSDEVVEKKWNGVYLSDPGTLGGETAQGQDKNLATALWELSERMVVSRLGNDALEKWDK